LAVVCIVVDTLTYPAVGFVVARRQSAKE